VTCSAVLHLTMDEIKDGAVHRSARAAPRTKELEMKLITIATFAATVAFAQTAESRTPVIQQPAKHNAKRAGSSPLCSLRNAWLVL
jgi:hypothetical protein